MSEPATKGTVMFAATLVMALLCFQAWLFFGPTFHATKRIEQMQPCSQKEQVK